MAQSDLNEFPDGGRATLVRRYSPALTKRQFYILTHCPYESPGFFQGEGVRQGRVLVRLGLLEEDPQTKGSFRVTEAGAAVIHLWKSAGWVS